MPIKKLIKERDWLVQLLKDFEHEAAGEQGKLDRVFGEERKRHLIGRIAFMNQKIARLPA